MRAFVFTDPALTSRAGQFVWLEMNTDDEKNAAPRGAAARWRRCPRSSSLDPADETVVDARVDGMTVAEMERLPRRGARRRRGRGSASPAEAALLRGRPPERRGEEAPRPRPPTVRRSTPAPAGWPPYGARGRVAPLPPAVAERGGEVPGPRPRGAARGSRARPRAVMVARSGLDCALGLGKEDAGRAAAIAEMEAATRRTLADPSLGAAADDVSSSYLSLIQARKDAGDAAGARKDAEAWAAFLEAQAAAAKTPGAARGLRLAPALGLPGARAAGAGDPDAPGVRDATCPTTTTRRPASRSPTWR